MNVSLAFWIIMLAAVVFGGIGLKTPGEPRWGWASWFVLFVLVFLLGYKVFGAPLQG